MTTDYPTMQRREDQNSPYTFTLSNIPKIDPNKKTRAAHGNNGALKPIWKPNKLQKWKNQGDA